LALRLQAQRRQITQLANKPPKLPTPSGPIQCRQFPLQSAVSLAEPNHGSPFEGPCCVMVGNTASRLTASQ